jgi:hypothetical protein
MSRSDVSLGRRWFLLRTGVAALTLGALAGCTVEDGLGGSGGLIDGRTSVPPLATRPPAGHVGVQMLPLTGVPVTIADGIYQRWRDRAKEMGIEVVHRLDEPAAYRVQGHLVAISHETATTIVFTYEIFDATGRRVHRIVGQEVARAADGDPWSGVDTDAQMRLAVRAARAIKAWLTRAAT